MKKVFLCLFMLGLVSSAYANDIQDLLKEVDPKPSDGRLGAHHPQIKDSEDYKSEGESIVIDGKTVKFKGRNTNLTDTSIVSSSTDGGSLTKSVSLGSNSSKSQFDNLESAAGEMIIKVEEDRNFKSKKYQQKLETTRETLTDAYIITEKIKLENLGKEQDPHVQNAFKCADLNDCEEDDKKSDKHKIKECKSNEMLQWTGEVWKCIGVFEQPARGGCAKDQYSKPVNGGIACINYIYQWVEAGWTACSTEGTQVMTYQCVKKKDADDKGSKVDASKCSFLGEPIEQERSC